MYLTLTPELSYYHVAWLVYCAKNGGKMLRGMDPLPRPAIFFSCATTIKLPDHGAETTKANLELFGMNFCTPFNISASITTHHDSQAMI